MSVWNRRAAALLLACTLWLVYAPPALAAQSAAVIQENLDSGKPPESSVAPNLALPPGLRPPDSAPSDPTEITGNRPDYYGKLQPLPVGTLPDLPEKVFCLTSVKGGWLDCPVEWDVSVLEGAGPGRCLVPGKLVLPEGYHFAESPPNALAPDFLEPYPLFFYVDGMEPETLMDITVPFFDSAQAEPIYRLGVGDAVQSLPFWDIEAVCETTSWETFSLPVRWKTQGIDLTRPGRYTLPGRIDLPPGFAAPNDFAPVSVRVEVGDARPVLLANPRLAGGDVVCDVTGAVDNLEWLRSERLMDLPNETWRDCHARPDESGRMRGYSVVYDKRTFTVLSGQLAGGSCFFRLRYQGVYSNALHVRVPLDGGTPEYALDDAVHAEPPPGNSLDGPSSGDRGGGDRNDQKPPPLFQRTPAPEEKTQFPDQGTLHPNGGALTPAAAPPLADEQSTGTGASLSGARLAHLAALDRNTVLFEKQGVAAELPSAFLRSLAPADQSRFEVTVEPVGANGFRLAVAADGKAVDTLPPTLVRLPLDWIPQLPLACYDAQGNFVCDALWDPALGVAAVKITRTGTYVVRAKEPEPTAAVPAAARPQPADADTSGPSKPPEPASSRFPPPLLAVLPAACVCLCLLLRRKRGRSHE